MSETTDLEPNDGVEVIEFTTKRSKVARDRDRHPTASTVTLVGEEFDVIRPKDFRLFALAGATSDLAAETDTWYQVIRLVDEIFDPVGRKRFFNRACDREDPLTAGAVFELLEELSDRWGATSATAAARPVVVGAHPDLNTGLKPVRIETDDFGERGLEMTFHPPKDLLLGIVASVLSTQADDEAIAWATALFLDGALPLGDRKALKRRLHTRYGDIDLDDFLDLVNTLLDRWHPQTKATNRQARRAQAAKKRKTTKTKTVRPATKITPPKNKGE